MAASLLALALVVGIGAWRGAGRSARTDGSPASSALAAAPAVSRPVVTVAPSVGPNWAELTASRQSTLHPLQALWPALGVDDKRRWLAVADRLRGLSSDARARVNARMVAWAKLTPRERAQVRLGYLDASRLPANDRARRWGDYQKLTRTPSQVATVHPKLEPTAPAMARIWPGATTVMMTDILTRNPSGESTQPGPTLGPPPG